MRPITFLVAVLAVAPLTRLIAQEPPPVKVGDRVRVTAPHEDIFRDIGTLARIDADTLVVGARAIAVEWVTRLEVSRGQKSRVGRGAVVGGLIGGAIGLGLAIAWVANDCEFADTSGCGSEVGIIAAGAAIVGLPGAGIGAAIGAVQRTDRWEEVPLDRLRVSFAPQRDGRFGLGLSVRF